MRKVILLNGPPRAGKDTAGDYLVSQLAGSKLKFSDPVKGGTHAAYELDVPTDHFEDVKDQRLPEFFGYTPRSCYIDHSERYMKPKHGKDIFGQLFVRRMIRSDDEIIIVPDSGFVEEAAPVLDEVGPDNVMVVRIHRDGKSFAGDSRSYINLPEAHTIDLRNIEGDPEGFCDRVLNSVQAFI